MIKSAILFIIVAFIATINGNKAYAADAPFGETCNDTTSICTSGLYCDPRVKICVQSSQTACSLAHPCPIGQTCFTMDKGNYTSLATRVSGTLNGLCGAQQSGASKNAFIDAFCAMYKFITSSVGKGVALAAVVTIGVFFFLGKITWGSVAAVAIGIGAMFGAPAVVGVLTGSPMSCD
jgi:type IV secretory pathway VirB2 component (pilin)